MTRYRVEHRTTYTYDDDVTDSLGIGHLVPRELPWQQVRGYDVVVAPTPGDLSRDVDYYGNTVVYFQVTTPHAELAVVGSGEVEVIPPAVDEEAAARPWESVRPLLVPDAAGD